MKRLFVISWCLFSVISGTAQSADAPNYANNSILPAGAAAASKITDNLVNLFTGQANVSVPIFSFKNNSGISASVSLVYMGGSGIQVGESPTFTGLGWYLNAGGSITRTVRGMPDDMPTNGFLYAATIPADWRSNGNKYYHDSLDAQQDIFQYSFPGHSGKFYIGKNGQIITVPLSKIRIIPTYQTATLNHQTLKSFRIIAEDGIKYDFEDADQTRINVDDQSYSPTPSGYYGVPHATAWNLTRIISAFENDTIKFNYITNGTGEYGFKFPQITYVKNSDGTRKTPAFAPGWGTSGFRKISSIEFPDNTTLQFVYSYGIKYNGSDYALTKIQIRDTALRFGYLLEYDSTEQYYPPGHGGPSYRPIKLMLKRIVPFTRYEKQEGYSFNYHAPRFPKLGEPGDTIQNMRDHWGYYNAATGNGDSLIPKISPYTWGADRKPRINSLASLLYNFTLPGGGYIAYGYEMNTHYPYYIENTDISITAENSSQQNVAFRQIYNNRHMISFVLDKSVSRSGSAPVSGPGELSVVIKNTAGTVTYLSKSISLYDLFYSGFQSWSFNLDTGTYRFETSLGAGTSVTGTLPLAVKWENRRPNYDSAYDYSGGLRVSYISKHNFSDGLEGSYEEYKYVREDGKSSGFLGDVPRYDFPFREVVNYGGTTTTDYTAICSEPLSSPGFVLGAPVGYSRVEIIRRTYAGNLGKEVQEFTDLKDVNSNAYPTSFPYTPQDFRAWGLGIPKRISVYDSSGNLVKRTVNTIQYDTVLYNTDHFKSIKLGHSQTTINGNPNQPGTPRTKTFIAETYYPASGRAYVTTTRDTLYHLNGTISTGYQHITYDTNYNVTKITSSYDRTRGLEKEERIYYPYNYTVGGGIGKLRDSAVLTLPVATETWITGDSNPRISAGLITSFRQIGNNDIKPDTIYSLETNKPIVQGTIGTFDPSKLNRNANYFKPQSYFTSYDSKGNLSEMKNLVSGLSNAVITAYDQQYAVAKVSNAVQSDIAYTSFETTNSGNWTIAGSARDNSDKLSGNKSYNLSNGAVSRSGLSTSTTYLLTVWAKNTASFTINGNSPGTAIASQHNWNLFSVVLTGISSITISGSGLIDEVRLHPKDANMETYCYEPLIGVITSVDANNTVVHSEYDRLNRLKVIRDKDRNIVKRFDFSDTTMTVSVLPQWQGFDKGCSNSTPGGVDSLYRDINPFSDSSGYVKRIYQGYLDCNCPEISNNPQYAVINGVCEMGTWAVVSSVYKKVIIDGYLQWRWECTYRYCFSDGSQSTFNTVGYYTSPCALTCSIDP